MDRRSFNRAILASLAALPFLGLLKKGLHADYLRVARKVLPSEEVGKYSVVEIIWRTSYYNSNTFHYLDSHRMDDLRIGDRFFIIKTDGYERNREGQKIIFVATSDYRKIDGPDHGGLEVEEI